MSDLVQTFDGNADGLVKEYLKIQRENVRLREEQKKTADDSRHHHDREKEALGEAKEGIGEQIAELGKMAVGWLSIEKGVEAVSEALEHQREIQKELATLQEQLGGSRASLARAMLGRTSEERELAKEGLEQIGLKAGIREPIANQALAAALETSGGDVGAALEQVEAAATVLPDANQAPELLSKISRQIGTAKRVTGADTAREALGRMLELGKQAGTSNVADTLENFLPRIEEMTKQGLDAEQSTDLMAASSKAFLPSDSTGEAAGRFALRMSRELQHFYSPEEVARRAKESLHSPTADTGLGELLGRQDVREKYGLRGELPSDPKILAKIVDDLPGLEEQYVAEQQARTADVDPNNLAETIFRLQRNERERAQFLKQAKLKGDIPKIEAAQLLDPSSQFAADFRAQLATETTPAQAVDYARQAAQDVRGDEATQFLQYKNVGETVAEQDETANVDWAMRGEALMGLERLRARGAHKGLGRALGGSIDAIMQATEFGLGLKTPEEVYQSQMREELHELQFEWQPQPLRGHVADIPRQMSADDRRQVRQIEQELAQFEQLKAAAARKRRRHEAVDAMREEIGENEGPTPNEAMERAGEIAGPEPAGERPAAWREFDKAWQEAAEEQGAPQAPGPSGRRPAGGRQRPATRQGASDGYDDGPEGHPGDMTRTNEILLELLSETRRGAGEHAAADRAAGARATAAVGGGREFGG